MTSQLNVMAGMLTFCFAIVCIALAERTHGASISIFQQELRQTTLKGTGVVTYICRFHLEMNGPAGRGTITTSEGCSPASSPKYYF